VKVNAAVTITCKATDPEGGKISYFWQVITGNAVLTSATTENQIICTPRTLGAVILRVQIIDDQNLADVRDVLINVIN